VTVPPSAPADAAPQRSRRRLDIWAARFALACVNLTTSWPPSWRRRLAALLGDLGWALVASRRRVTLANLRACFPELDETQRRDLGRRLFRNLARATLDHSVLWKGSLAQIEQHIRIDGLARLHDPANRPLILLAPHFVGLDAGGVRVTTVTHAATIYARQSNPVWDRALAQGRSRFILPVLIARRGADLRAAVRAMRQGLPFYYLPDIDPGESNGIFVPFMGVSTATLPMVSRLARMIGARVMMTVTEQTEDGYVMHLEAPWEDFPGPSVGHDTERMNREIERWVRRLPDQYLWTHRRFKTRPAGEAPFY
jgi:Kdo2-lipid IVA lauroyltransferase/acyltransferase